jgi:ABC-type dipeptide/oligopeptide/nickel transport system ATPase subunit
LIFQDPGASLNPNFTVLQALLEPGRIRGSLDTNAVELLQQVGLPASCISQRTSQLSGGQKARVALARALAALDLSDEAVLILDESLSSLDASIQAQMINLLVDLQEKYRLTYVLVVHDLLLAGHLADEVAVMSAGEIVERGSAPEVLLLPLHPYTKRLVSTFTLASDSGNA